MRDDRGYRGEGGSGLVSVIIPCYNAEPYVSETIRSVLDQTYARVEVIVVDDASADGSGGVIQGFADRVRAVRLPKNRGGSHARNRGAELAQGDYLMFLDADDLLGSDTLAVLVDAIRGAPGKIAIAPWSWFRLGPDGLWTDAPSEVPQPSRERERALRDWISGASWAPPCAVLWERDVYERTGGWDDQVSLNDDGDLMMRALADGAEIIPLAEGRSYYRVHPESRVSVSTNLFDGGRIRSGMRVLEKLVARLEANGEVADYRVSLAIGYQRLALTAFHFGHIDLARECQRRGRSFGGTRIVSPTKVGRVLERLVGLEAKERVAALAARFRIATVGRRTRIRRAQLHHREPGAGS